MCVFGGESKRDKAFTENGNRVVVQAGGGAQSYYDIFFYGRGEAGNEDFAWYIYSYFNILVDIVCV